MTAAAAAADVDDSIKRKRYRASLKNPCPILTPSSRYLPVHDKPFSLPFSEIANCNLRQTPTVKERENVVPTHTQKQRSRFV